MTGFSAKYRAGRMMQIKPIGPVNGHVLPPVAIARTGGSD
jgi:hypothetical protein